MRTVGLRATPIAVLFCLSACSAGTSPSASPIPTPTALPFPTALPTSSLQAELAGSEAVQFLSLDGIKLQGRVFGSGSVGVVLAHGAAEDGQAQGEWFPFARKLADNGYMAMTLDLRGYCPGGLNGCSEGTTIGPDTWQDVMGAVKVLRDRGATKVFAMGASGGARSCVWAASRPGTNLDGVIGVSTPQNAIAQYSPGYDFTAAVIGAIHAPILFVAGDQDKTFAAEATTMYGWANEPKKLAIVGSSDHGALLMQQAGAAAAVLDFLLEHS